MKSKNYSISGLPESQLKRLEEDYNFLGRDTVLRNGTLTVLAVSPKHKKDQKKREDKGTNR